jgi:hypothetical protein
VEPEMYGYTGYSWSHWNSNEKLKEKSVSYTGKTFDRFITADSCTGNSTHNTESAAVWNLKAERWGVINSLTLCRLTIYIYIYIYMCVCVCVCHTAPLTSRRCILNIYSTNIRTEYFQHAA